MTTIAWDGNMLAADKQFGFQNLGGTTTKIFKLEKGELKGSLVGFAGTFCIGMEMLNWFNNGAKPNDFPKKQESPEQFCSCLLINKQSEIYRWEHTPYPYRIEEKFWSIGSGRDFAIAAMHCGKNAKEAIAIASKFDTDTGKGVNVLKLEMGQLSQ